MSVANITLTLPTPEQRAIDLFNSYGAPVDCAHHIELDNVNQSYVCHRCNYVVSYDMTIDGPRPASIAQEKSREILLRHLDRKQRESFEKHLRFDVVASNGKTFTISYGTVYNIEGDDGHKYCVSAIEGQTPPLTQNWGYPLPTCDQLLAQKLLIETDVDTFYLFANKRPPPEDTPRCASITDTTNDNTIWVIFDPNTGGYVYDVCDTSS